MTSKEDLIHWYNVQIIQLDKDIHRATAKCDWYKDEIIKLQEKQKVK